MVARFLPLAFSLLVNVAKLEKMATPLHQFLLYAILLPFEACILAFSNEWLLIYGVRSFFLALCDAKLEVMESCQFCNFRNTKTRWARRQIII
jgi:hypothetical protein